MMASVHSVLFVAVCKQTSKGFFSLITDPLFGSTLAAVCANDKSPVPKFLLNCFREIESRGTVNLHVSVALMALVLLPQY
jgi:hypothetical protein